MNKLNKAKYIYITKNSGHETKHIFWHKLVGVYKTNQQHKWWGNAPENELSLECKKISARSIRIHFIFMQMYP